MNRINKILKTLVLSMAMTALMLLPLTVNAQYDENKFGIQPWFGSSLLGRESGKRGAADASINGGGIQNGDFEDVPLGSGIAILLVAGLGYVALKKKEDEQ